MRRLAQASGAQLRIGESITTNVDLREAEAAVPLRTAIGGYGFRARAGARPGMTINRLVESVAAIRAKTRLWRAAMRCAAVNRENFFIAKNRDSESARVAFRRHR